MKSRPGNHPSLGREKDYSDVGMDSDLTDTGEDFGGLSPDVVTHDHSMDHRLKRWMVSSRVRTFCSYNEGKHGHRSRFMQKKRNSVVSVTKISSFSLQYEFELFGATAFELADDRRSGLACRCIAIWFQRQSFGISQSIGFLSISDIFIFINETSINYIRNNYHKYLSEISINFSSMIREIP